MSNRNRRARFTFAVSVFLAALVPLTLGTKAAATLVGESVVERRCFVGTLIGERTILVPEPQSFYSVDALNPDIVARREKYFLFFSGNNVHTSGGDWRTGVATSRRPAGPFRVKPRLRGNFLNGGTVVWKGSFWQAHHHNVHGAQLAVSTDGLTWRRVTSIPDPAQRGWPATGDYFLERLRSGLRVYMLARPATSGFAGSIASIDWKGRRWSRFRILLSPGQASWENIDLGEPASLSLPGRHLLLYTATGEGFRRTIGVARRTRHGYVRCRLRPLIGPGAPWGPDVSIDPSVLVVADRLYVYYGGGVGNSIAADLHGAIGVRVYRLPQQRR